MAARAHDSLSVPPVADPAGAGAEPAGAGGGPAAPVLIGWRERVDIPAWDLRGVRAKIDTGARTSAIDVAGYELIGGGLVRFEVVGRLRPARRTRRVVAPVARVARVRPTTGEPGERIVCRVGVAIGGEVREIEVGLVCRRGMLCRMLIGRAAVAGGFVVDPSRKYLLGRPPAGRGRETGP